MVTIRGVIVRPGVVTKMSAAEIIISRRIPQHPDNNIGTGATSARDCSLAITPIAFAQQEGLTRTRAAGTIDCQLAHSRTSQAKAIGSGVPNVKASFILQIREVTVPQGPDTLALGLRTIAL